MQFILRAILTTHEKHGMVFGEILDIISSLENKSTGPSSKLLKLLTLIPDIIIVPLAYIINMSLLTGEYPDLLKLVLPIHKGGSTQDVNNYRPISTIHF